MSGYPVEVTVDGKKYSSAVEAGETLLQLLRDRLGLKETKCGCGKGDCGTCVVRFEDKVVKSCLVLALQANQKEVVTLVGVGRQELGRRLQESFVEHGAIQCGFCTSGMIVAAQGLLQRNPRPTRIQIREAISGNLCRCTGYQKIVDAIYFVSSNGGDDNVL